MELFNSVESNVKSYCRTFPEVFHKAKGAKLFNESGEEYIDFFAGAGALNYGHNNGYIKERLINYIQSDAITHGLDMYTKAKREFIQKFVDSILTPRDLNYKLQFCGPTGTNAVEAALKLARKVKKRTNIFSFMGAFHGMSMGSLAATSGIGSRQGAGVPLDNVTFIPYPVGCMGNIDTIQYIETILTDDHSGIEKPAAIIVETTQAEGGINVTSVEWLRSLSELCNKHDILLICDDIQVGCGRTGEFFSFERAGIVPDMVVLSKSISGYGLPMSLLLLKPELDIWTPGEHNGTFRGNQMAFVAATAALEYRENTNMDKGTKEREEFIKNFLNERIKPLHKDFDIRGIGMIWGIDFSLLGGEKSSKEIVTRCFDNNLIIERAGREDVVVKIMPPLNIEMDVLEEGCKILEKSIIEFLSNSEYGIAIESKIEETV
ncbi:diaminobutyrate--2-oxoglutarate transaminase [Clostridium cellulovorans]|uniref:Diaminobutyrate--2-oxoglutarate transaminase n=1 Tax=Clostridium cellulovorans (strain ATCC 35296 / DSM 3052 / OCM 3 / 743B) TaxID=573061 RepID=D9SQJ0_CLOC7|nr:diaminobutyrate--2-oxoglutarate transaminase [Clostridium cellulovorans]ADL52196.1 2,4-diaminobutyrate 4-transaminase [Clostridium cellulovorans 743B]